MHSKESKPSGSEAQRRQRWMLTVGQEEGVIPESWVELQRWSHKEREHPCGKARAKLWGKKGGLGTETDLWDCSFEFRLMDRWEEG